MKTGISTACLYGRCETEQALAEIEGLGAQTCEVRLQTFYEYRPEFAKKHAGGLKNATVYSLCANPANFEGQLFSSSRRIRGDGQYWLDQLMRSAQLFHADKYTFNGFIRKPHTADDFGDWSAHMCEITAFCAQYGVKVCIKNTSWGLYNRTGIFRELKNRCGELLGVFDNKEARRSGYPYGMYINDMCGAISHVRLSDADKDGATCLPGFGCLDFTELFKRLKDCGFDGAVLLDTNRFGDVRDLKRSLEYINEIIYKL